ncbi:hypothetical protein [Cutibacterium sp.]|uniref:hypothetical protein n=1 Tax=Cutibacterium sp. TaxID=1912221 RepID=UPI0026DBDFB6|nr:hypothetical protein [Cutibacterium sp.]MDO4411758.1 hypothetical protein [Cutibacterium sp.]
MKKVIATALATLAVSSFSIAAVPAQAAPEPTAVENAVAAQPKTQVRGIAYALCSYYPDWCGPQWQIPQK